MMRNGSAMELMNSHEGLPGRRKQRGVKVVYSAVVVVDAGRIDVLPDGSGAEEDVLMAICKESEVQLVFDLL